MMNFDNPAAIVRRMDSIREHMVQKAARKAVRAGAKVIAEAMQSRAPIGSKRSPKSTALEPGAVKEDIGVRGGGVVDGEVTAFAGPSGKTAHVARWVEWGHRNVKGGRSAVVAGGKTRGPGKYTGSDTPAHPFLRPAYEASKAEAETTRDAVLREELSNA